MSYTLEQKRDALKSNELWWRFPEWDDDHHRKWTLMNVDLDGCIVMPSDFDMTGAEYFIGPTPPRVLSELEGELLEALKAVLPYLTDGEDAGDEATQLAPIVRAAIKKAESTP
mgnify:CR=1 FL=1